ncbi:MAG: hypothetical protein ACI8TF_002558 [Paracoccaceae bacterium]|jgi:uncharacterized protein (TIGR01244 family)
MELRQISANYAVAPQLDPADMAVLAADGVTTIICNRPDMENPPSHQAVQLQTAAEAAGLIFIFNPVIGSAMTMENVEEQSEVLLSSDGPIVAYCASGNRSAVMWALANAGDMETDQILMATAAAGYPLEGLRGQIDAMATQDG